MPAAKSKLSSSAAPDIDLNKIEDSSNTKFDLVSQFANATMTVESICTVLKNTADCAKNLKYKEWKKEELQARGISKSNLKKFDFARPADIKTPKNLDEVRKDDEKQPMLKGILLRDSNDFFVKIEKSSLTLNDLREIVSQLAKDWLFKIELNTHTKRDDVIRYIQYVWIKYIFDSLEFIRNRDAIIRLNNSKDLFRGAISNIMKKFQQDAKQKGVVTDAEYDALVEKVASEACATACKEIGQLLTDQ